MNIAMVTLGTLLAVFGALITFFTFGIGIICTWPLILVGIILLIVGAIIPNETITFVSNQNINKREPKRYKGCPECGGSVPYDSDVCPYCGEKIK
jgi:hypothetical protein